MLLSVLYWEDWEDFFLDESDILILDITMSRMEHVDPIKL